MVDCRIEMEIAAQQNKYALWAVAGASAFSAREDMHPISARGRMTMACR
jgi:hypothetical protein